MKKLLSLLLVIVLAFALVTVASAASTPSPTTDGTPTIVPVDVDGTTASAVMTKADGSKVAVTDAEITKVAATSAQASDELKAAYSQLSSTTNVATVVSGLDDVAAAIDPSYNSSVFVVSQVFSVDLTPDLEALFAQGAKVEVGFRMSLGENEANPTVIHQVDGVWKIVPASDVSYDSANQTLKVNFDSLCPVAILSVVPENLIANNGQVPVIVYILLAVIVVLVIVLIILVITLLKLVNKLKALENKNGPKDDGPKEEPKEEAPVEEAVEEAPVEEAPAEEVVEETPVEEAPAEEVVEEAPVEEAPAEEVVEEAPVEEAPVEEETEEEVPAEAAAVAGDGVVLVRYRKSYEARLAQAPDQTKEYYAAIKEAFLGIKNVKARKAWSSETFSRGRIKLAKIVVKGKTLVVSLAIDPKELEGTKYHFQDKSAEKKYAEYPTVMKLSSARNAKHVLEIIEKMVTLKELVKSNKPVEKVVVPYETQDELIARGAIKVMTTGAASDSAVYEKVNIKEFINGTQE